MENIKGKLDLKQTYINRLIETLETCIYEINETDKQFQEGSMYGYDNSIECLLKIYHYSNRFISKSKELIARDSTITKYNNIQKLCNQYSKKFYTYTTYCNKVSQQPILILTHKSYQELLQRDSANACSNLLLEVKLYLFKEAKKEMSEKIKRKTDELKYLDKLYTQTSKKVESLEKRKLNETQQQQLKQLNSEKYSLKDYIRNQIKVLNNLKQKQQQMQEKFNSELNALMEERDY